MTRTPPRPPSAGVVERVEKAIAEALKPYRDHIGRGENVHEWIARRCANEAAIAALPTHSNDAVGALVDEATFLCARLREVENELDDDHTGREFNGHVVPSLARLEALLSTLSTAAPTKQGEAE